MNIDPGQVAKHYIDVNRTLEEVASGSLAECGTVDVYINGSLDADDVTDYCREWPEGTKYEIKDIKTNAGFQCTEPSSGSISGTVGTGNVDIRLVYVLTGQEMSGGYNRVLPDGDYMIVRAGDPSYYLDIAGTDSPAANGTNVNVYGPISVDLDAVDTWTITYSGGFYSICQKGSAATLDVTDGSRANRTNVRVWQKNDSSAQKWAITHFDGGMGYRVRAKCSGYSLDAYGGEMKAGVNVLQFSENTSIAQRWLFIPYSPARTIADGRYVLVSGADPHAELDVPGDTGSISDGENIEIWNDSCPSRYNSFDVRYVGGGYYNLVHAASGKYLEVGGSSTDNGGNIQLSSSSGHNSQKWCIISRNGGYMLVNRNSGLAMDLENGSMANATNVCQHYYNDSKTEAWSFKKAEYRVAYDANGGTGAPAAQTKYYANALTLSSVKPTWTGHVFKGWAKRRTAAAAEYQAGASYTADSDVTLYAVWETPIGNASVSGITNKTYTGAVLTQSPTVVVGSTTLVNGTDYILSYTNNLNAGIATVTITGKGNYSGSLSRTFTISPASIAGASVSGITDRTYTGRAQTQSPVIKAGEKTLTNGTDYTLSYSNNTEPGTAAVTITGKGNYSGSLNRTFTIGAASITGANVSGIENRTYTGEAQTQSLTVKMGEKTLTNGTDYTLSYTNNTDAGTAAVTITGKGNYTGSLNKTFTISAASVSDASVSWVWDMTYTGSALTQPNPIVTMGEKTLLKETDYTLSYENNMNAGTATMMVTGKGNYNGTVIKTFQIAPFPITEVSVSGVVNKTYTGNAQTQNLILTMGEKALVEGVDYELTYHNNTKAGAATIIVRGKGNFNSARGIVFGILEAPISDASVSGITDRTYIGSPQTQSPTVKMGEKTLVEGTDYTLSYADNINVGTATVTITGKGNYTGSLNRAFTISSPASQGPVIVTHPAGTTRQAGTTAVFSVRAQGSGLSYQWQYKEKGSSTWNKCGLTGAKTPDLQVPATTARNGYSYRCVVTDADMKSVTSNAAVLTVSGGLAITKHPENKEAEAGKTVYFSVAASGSGLSYQWQYKEKGGSTWNRCGLTGAKTDTVDVPATAVRDGYSYRCVVTDGLGNTAVSNSAVLTILRNEDVFAITSHPVSRTSTVGKTVTFSVKATGKGLTYQWQYRPAGAGAWYRCGLTGAKTDTVTVPVTEGRNGTSYRCTVTDALGSILESRAATLSVGGELAIIRHPLPVTAPAGSMASFSVTAAGTGLSYQWEYQLPGKTVWNKCGLTGAKTDTVRVPVTAERNGYSYRCVITDQEGTSLVSNRAVLTVSGANGAAGMLVPGDAEEISETAVIPKDHTEAATAEETAESSSDQEDTVPGTEDTEERVSDESETDDAEEAQAAPVGTDQTEEAVTSVEAAGSEEGAGTAGAEEGTEPVGVEEKADAEEEAPVILSIVSQPESTKVEEGDTARLEAEAEGEGLTYKWQYRSVDGKEWKDIDMSTLKELGLEAKDAEGAEENVFAVRADAILEGLVFRCVVSDRYGKTTISDEACIIVIVRLVADDFETEYNM